MSDLLEKYHNGLATEQELLQYIELIGGYLGLKTIAQKAKELNTDYNNVKKSAIKKVTLFGVKFVIDNE